MSSTERYETVLTSWKEIASYLGKGVRTVQRWESELGLPIHRPNGKDKGIVCAKPEDLDHWLAQNWSTVDRQQKSTACDVSEIRSAIASSRQLRSSQKELVRQVRVSAESSSRNASARWIA